MADERINLADPDFEPTDEQLRELSRRAFAGVREQHQAALKRIHQEIAKGRQDRRQHWGDTKNRKP
ncbi:hypothetical protein LVJ94_46755 [Pendulispora rubella]|uniref:Uncharacterized protein n=1 Tax=Pendulispora rubella TaxID=2741070 RepID=A0ABZ2L6T0_9BACT